jgi:kumamolisin
MERGLPWPSSMHFPGRPSHRRALALLLVAALALSGTTLAAGAVARSPPAPVAASSFGVLPAALEAPLADRLGFEPAAASEVPYAVPVRGELEFSVRLWPSQGSMFLPRPTGAAPLTSSEVRADFAPAPGVYAAWQSYLAGFGIAAGPLSADGMQFFSTAPAPAVDRAFSTTVEQGSWQGRSVEFPEPAPSLPAPLAASALAVLGLESGWSEFTLPFHPLQTTENLITPDEAHDAYGLSGLYNYSGSSHWATSVSVAVLLWGDGYDPSDLSTFFSRYYPGGWPLPNVVPNPVDGAPSPGPGAVSDPSQAPIELTLDIEWAGSTAPGATVDAVYAPDGPSSNNYSPSDVSLDHALSTAVGLGGVVVVSMSFATVDGADTSLQAAFESTFASATQSGITFVAASGDNGGAERSGGSCTTTPQPQYPAASGQVLAVGGTAPVLDVSVTGQVTGIDNEPAWNGSGGGYSVDYGVPSWQQGVPAVTAAGHRGIPDVAGPAAYNFLYFGGTTRVGDGTSFAAPFWGGIVAEMVAIRGTPFGLLDPRLYAIGQAEPNGTVAPGLVDITAGSNCIDSAGPGWDPVTGWGTPRAMLLYEDLVSSYVRLNLTLGTSTVAPGGSLTANALVLNTSTFHPLANLEVTFTSSSEAGYAGPCGGTFTSASGTTDANGTVSVSLSVSSCYIGSHASVVATILEGGYFGSNQTSVTVNLLGLAGFLAIITQFPYNVIAFVLIVLAAVVIGRSLSHRAKRKAAVARIRAAGTPAPAAARPSSPAGPPAAGPAPARTPPPPPTASTTGPPPPASMAPRAPPPAPAPRPPIAPPGLCSVCGFPLDPALSFCPRCGTYLPAPTTSPSAPPSPPPPP